jgi:MSHA pilin protein MshB
MLCFKEPKMKRNLVKQQGFTIVELVVVIILLGILAATALPRFIDIDDDAHAAAFEGVLGGFSTGVALYHAQWIAEGQAAAGTPAPDFDGLRTTPQGYPYSTVSQVGNVPTNSADCATVFVGLLQSAPTVSDDASLAAIAGSTTDFTAVRNGVDCEFYYTAQSNASGETVAYFTYESDTGTVIQNTPVAIP